MFTPKLSENIFEYQSTKVAFKEMRTEYGRSDGEYLRFKFSEIILDKNHFRILIGNKSTEPNSFAATKPDPN